MFGNNAMRLAALAIKVPSRGMSGIGISGPPQRRIAFPVKIGYGAVMVGGACFYPLWVLVHLKDYKGQGSE